MLGFITKGWTVWNTIKTAGLLSGVSYLWSAAEQKPEDRKFKNFVDNTVAPVVTDGAKRAMTGVGNIVSDLTTSDSAKNTMVGAADLTTTGLNTAGGLIGQLPSASQAASTAGQAVSNTAEVTQNTLKSFLKYFVPESMLGWAAGAAGAFGVASLLKTGVGGEVLKNLSGKLLELPTGIVTATLGFAGQVLAPFAYIGAALALGWLLLTDNGRQLMSDAYQSVRGWFHGTKQPEQEHQHNHAPTVTPTVTPTPAVDPSLPRTTPGEMKPELMAGVKFDGISGGGNVTTTPTSSGLPNDPALNPRRDIRNSPSVVTGA